MLHLQAMPLAAPKMTCFAAVALLLLGCGQARDAPRKQTTAAPSRTPTFARDVAPIIHANCSVCHHEGGPAPFALIDYDDVNDHATQIVELTQRGLMPPWLPREGYGRFEGERRLSAADKQLIADWVEQGRAPGELAEAPTPPSFPTGWALGEPDLLLEAEGAWEVPAEGADIYRNFVIAVPPEATGFVKTVELRPGSPQVVHHAVMRVDAEGEARRLDAADPEPGFEGMVVAGARMPGGHFVGWTPGKTPYAGSDERAWQLVGGSDLVVQLHVRPTGKPERVRPAVGIHFAQKPPSKPALALVLSSTDIDIAPGDADYRLVDTLELPADVRVLSLYPHAHYIAKQIEAFATLPDGRREWLIKIDDWDFNWQDQYRYLHPIILPKGSVITMSHRYDNSAANPRNPSSPPQRVSFGPSSTDEMAELILEVEPIDPRDLAVLDRALEAKWLEVQIETVERTLAANPDDAGSLANLASLQAHAQQPRAAAQTYARSLALREHAGTRVDYAIVLAALGEAEAAEAQLDAALRIEPEHARAHLVRANHRRAAGRLDEAVAAYQRAIAADPQLAEAHNNLGVTYEALGRPKLAVEAFSRAVELAPQQARFHENHGRALEAATRRREAIAAYRAALERDGGSIRAMRGLAWILATAAEDDLRDPAQAIRIAEAGSRSTGFRSPELLEALAAGLAASGQFEAAREAIGRAIELASVAGRGDLVERYRGHAALFERERAIVLGEG